MAKALRFIIVPKVAHPRSDEVKRREAQADVITQENVDSYLERQSSGPMPYGYPSSWRSSGCGPPDP